MGRMRRGWAAWLASALTLVSVSACSHTKTQSKGRAAASTPTSAAESGVDASGLVYADTKLGFEISRPQGDAWQFSPGEGESNERVSVPVIVAHRETGAQVVVQVAPAVVSPNQFAQRLTAGLHHQPGFTTTEIEPLPMDGAFGFAFALGDKVAGRVAVVGGASGKVYVLLATWPQDAPPAVISGVDEIVRSLRTTQKT
jgi:hypothetical protein